MIKQDFVEYPEHRLNLFKLLSSLTTHCFHRTLRNSHPSNKSFMTDDLYMIALLKLSPSQYKAFMNSIVWSMKHTGRDVSETGLQRKSAVQSSLLLRTDLSSCSLYRAREYFCIHG